MPAKKNSKRIVTNPLENRNVGRRTGRDIKAGKNIRKIAGGFENFDDYWSESDADLTREGTFVKPNTPKEVTAVKKGSQSGISLQLDPSSVLAQSQIGNIQPVNNALNPFTNKQIGRRTGKDMKAGKNIRILDGGFENFDDYWSESDAESLASFCTTTSNKSKAERRSCEPAKAANRASTISLKSAVLQQNSSRSSAEQTLQEKDDTEESGKKQVKPAATSRSKHEIFEDTATADNQAETSFSEDVDSHDSESVSRGVDSQKEKDMSKEESEQSEEDGEVEQLDKREENPDNTKNLKLQTESKISCQRENMTVQSHQRKKSVSSSFTELHADHSAKSNQSRTSSKTTTVITSKQDSAGIAGEYLNSPAEKQQSKSSSKLQRSSAQRESRVVDSEGEEQHSKVHRISATYDKGLAADQSTSDVGHSEQSEATEQHCTGTAPKNTGSSRMAKKLPVLSEETDTSSKRKVKQTEKEKPPTNPPLTTTVSQLTSLGHDDVSAHQSTSHQNGTGTSQSQSQISAIESPQPTLRKSSVYLSLAGDITGSLTRLSNTTALSPEPRLYGTRRRLSYAESPGKRKQPKANGGMKKSRAPQLSFKASNSQVVSSSVPEEQKEDADDQVPPSVPQCPEGGAVSSSQSDFAKEDPAACLQQQQQQDPEDDPASSLQSDSPEENQSPSSQPAAKENPIVQQSSEQLKKKSAYTNQRQNPQVDSEPSQNSVSEEMGMFVSLASQTQNRLNTLSAGASSDCDEDGFEIVEENKVYGVPVGHKATRGMIKNRVKKEAGTKRGSSAERDRNHVLVKETQHKDTNKSVSKRKTAERSLSFDENKRTQPSADTQVHVKQKDRKGSGKENHLEAAEPEHHGTSLLENESRNGKRCKIISEKNLQKISSNGSQEPSADVEEERPVRTKKSGKVVEKKSVSNADISVLSPKRSRHEAKEMNKKLKKKTVGKLPDAYDDDESSPLEPENLNKKTKPESKSERQKSVGDNATENEPMVQENTANSESFTHHRQVRKTKKTKTQHSTEVEPSVQEAPAILESPTHHTPVSKRKKAIAQSKTKDTAECSPPVRQQGRERRKRSTKSETRMSDIVQKMDSTKTSEIGKIGSSGTTRGMSPAKKACRAEASVSHEDTENLVENEEEEERGIIYTPRDQSIQDVCRDSALKSGISFRHFSHLPSSVETMQSQCDGPEVVEDIVSTPALGTHPRQSQGPSSILQNSRPVQTFPATPLSGWKDAKDSAKKKKGRRVTISDNVTRRSFSPAETEKSTNDSSVLPSMSATPVHYYQLSTSASSNETALDNKLVHPDDKATGLRRSQRTRVKPLEWYKNERIVYDRRRSGAVIVGVKPSREHIYLEQENLKRRKRRQQYLIKKKQQTTRNHVKKRLSTHVSMPSNLDVTESTDIPVVNPDTKEEVLMCCFNPSARASAIGPSGNSPSPGDPFSLKLITQQNLFTTGVLTLAAACEKPLQRTMSTAVLYFITYGKVLVTINRATTVLETGDHFFVPRGTVYSLKNLRKEEASLSFANLMVDQPDSADLGQPS